MIALRMLGPLELDVDGLAVEIPGVRTRAVLARLALEAGGIVSVDRLIDDVWGATTPANALNALQVRVSQLRSMIGRDTIRAARPGYVLDISRGEVDALAVETEIATARRLMSVSPDKAASAFRQALDRWRGPSFAGLGDAPFSVAAAVRWDELRLGALEDQLQLAMRAGRISGWLPDLEALTVAHPLREPFHELLIRAYASLGRQADALTAYRRIREQLVEELGIDPGRKLQDLESAVLRQDPSLLGEGAGDSEEPHTPRLLPLSADRAEPVDELATVVAGNVSRPISKLLHREADIGAVQSMLATQALVTITGPAGVGKTRLALEMAGLIPRPAHGVWFVGLEGTTRADQVADSIAVAVGAPLDQPMVSLRNRFRGAHALLLVDNCEHLGDGPANVIRNLLEHCPNLRVLATSQRPLGLQGEAVWPLEPLARSEALELFALRVAEHNPRVVFDPPTLASADRVCAALDDLPLAIELAARRCGVLSVDEVAERLRDRFSLLADNGANRPERHRTLAGAIGWSYDLLFPDAQLLLQIIAAFPEGATLDAVEDVAHVMGVPGGEVLDLLAQLVDRSLVVADRNRSKTRYTVLNSIRAFSVAKSGVESRTDDIRAAQARWVARLASKCPAGLRSDNQAGWLATVRDERANINLAFDWLIANEPGASLVLVNDLYLGWLITGDSEAAELRLGAALRVAVESPLPLRTRVSACRAVILARLGRHEEARPLADWAFANLDSDTPHGIALTRSIIGQVHSLAGRFEPGLAMMRQSCADLATLGDTWAQAISTLNVALTVGRTGDHRLQEELTREALGLLRPHNDPFVRRLALRNLALVQLRSGASADALDGLTEALHYERQIGFTTEEAATLRLMGRAHVLLGEPVQAESSLRQSMATSERLGDLASTDLALADLIARCRARGDFALARALLDRHHSTSSFTSSMSDESRLGVALRIQIGALEAQTGDPLGIARVERALAEAMQQSNTHQQVLALDVLARFSTGFATHGGTVSSGTSEADRIAESIGLHRLERPDRVD